MGMLAEALTRQFDRHWEMLIDGVTKVPDDEWCQGPTHFMVPARLAFHAVQAVDYHLDDNRATFDWNAFGVDWEESEPEALPDKAALLAYLERVQAKARRWINQLDDQGLLEEPGAFHFLCPLEQALYLLRHTQYHHGQIDAEMHRRGCPSATWC
jgi:uncharacterized damage-inducible protein DinB